MPPWAHPRLPSPQPKWHLDQFSHFLHGLQQGVVGHVSACLSSSKLPFPMGIWTLSNTWFFGSTQISIPNGMSISSAVFAQLLTADNPYALQWGAPSPKNCPFPWGIRIPSNTWFLGPIQLHNPNVILTGSAVFAWLTSHDCDKQTDRRRYSVCNNSHILSSMEMWPKIGPLPLKIWKYCNSHIHNICKRNDVCAQLSSLKLAETGNLKICNKIFPSNYYRICLMNYT